MRTQYQTVSAASDYCVVIMNLLIGLTVSRTEELRLQADEIRLKKTVHQVTTTQDIMTNTDTALFKILPKRLREKISNYGKLFNYRKRNAISSDISSTKLCFRPKLRATSFGRLASGFGTYANQRTDSNKGITFATEYVELHLYNENNETKHALKTKLYFFRGAHQNTASQKRIHPFASV